MIYFEVIDYEKLQHYKDRNPPWIKLYNDLLDNYEFSCLQDASKLHLIMIYLLASRHENKIPYDCGWIARRINASETVDLEVLEKFGFIRKVTTNNSASTMLAHCYQDATQQNNDDLSHATDTRKEPNLGVTPSLLPSLRSCSTASINSIKNNSLNNASAMLADCKQNAMPETERETETEYKEKQEKEKLNGHNFRTEAKEVLEFLNRKTGKNYEAVSANLDFIMARLKEGASISDCRMIIASRYRKWHTDEKMKDYLRPKTLFNKTNFWTYKGELAKVEDE